ITDAMLQNLNWQLRNNLVEVDYQGKPTPELAESFESTPDAAQWIFKLRKGVEFHNGKTLDADDVVDTINYHRGKDSKSAAKSLLEAVTEVKADGKQTVVFSLEGGNADFPFILAAYHLTIQPAGTRGAEFGKGIGTGAYQLVSFEPGVRAFVKKNPNYWKAGRGHFDEVETLGIADYNARTNALKTGQLDFINRCELKTVHLLKRDPNLQIIQTTGTRHYTLPMRCDVAPYDNNDVRLALKYAIDREQMVKLILRGFGRVANDHPIGPSQRFYAAELPQRAYDPEKAKFHLKKAGLGEHTFNLHTADAAFGGAVDAAVLFKESAARAGIKIEVVQEPNDGYWSNVWMKKSFCTCFWSGRATADWMFSTAYAEDAAWNDTFWKHERFNTLLKEARAILDEQKRRGMYAELQQIVRDEGGVVVPMYADYVAAASKKLRFENVAGNWPMDGHKNTERWWFA
ncbi:MAG: ABC transporter substrate-binding protein, partial [Xanthomonadales bacterium]|nr:ABC transporter substrate-binding protein [Xanthomonadales bacterium]